MVCKEYQDGDFCIYKRGARTAPVVRRPHSRKRVLEDKNFERTRKHAKDMARASVLASQEEFADPSN
jgi:hypothetical protein